MASLSEIKESFFSRSFQFDLVSDILIGIAAVACIVVIHSVYKAIKRRRMRYNPFGSITDPKAIRSIFRLAFDQRRPLEVQVHTDSDQRRPTLRCSPEYLGKDSITIEINGLKSLSDRWLGHAVHVFFRVQLDKEFTYYTFSSEIGGIHMPKQGLCHITLPLPLHLENRQKRSFLRITPPPDFLMGAAIWYGHAMPPENKLDEISSWPRPLLLFIPGRMEQFQTQDISAGGARIRIPQQLVKDHSLQFATSEQIILMLDIFDPDQSKRMRFWMRCRVQSVWLEHASKDVQLGVQFLAWAKPREASDLGEKTDGIEWLRLSSSSEVELLGNWIMRRHLELFRDTPTSNL